MLQLRPGDLVAVRKGDVAVSFAVLTKQILFGGHWSFVFYRGESELQVASADAGQVGFNAFVDFIAPKREGRLMRLSRGSAFCQLMGPELLQQEPLRGELNYRIWRWKDNQRDEVEYVRYTPQPTPAERQSPRYSCFPADFACDLAARRWKLGTSLWVA